MDLRVAAVICCLLVVTVPLAAPVATAAPSPTGPAAGGDSANGCFPSEGYEFTIGTQGPQIGMVLHLSLLTNLGGPGAVGIELSGSIDGPPIIELKTGVAFDGIESVGAFLNDPFAAFSIIYDYRFELPMLGSGSLDHEESEPPISGPINTTGC
ncbi:DUF7332 family protein [Halohasta salina]|uniref:DUF7332 family protein n=1 Tax=Halohasta salina TaxID=2961621 RepID=UPI0020A5A4D9|nr:hypothetical protein [Halohasta salina]